MESDAKKCDINIQFYQTHPSEFNYADLINFRSFHPLVTGAALQVIILHKGNSLVKFAPLDWHTQYPHTCVVALC